MDELLAFMAGRGLWPPHNSHICIFRVAEYVIPGTKITLKAPEKQQMQKKYCSLSFLPQNRILNCHVKDILSVPGNSKHSTPGILGPENSVQTDLVF